jgi:hypothetical protein
MKLISCLSVDIIVFFFRVYCSQAHLHITECIL